MKRMYKQKRQCKYCEGTKFSVAGRVCSKCLGTGLAPGETRKHFFKDRRELLLRRRNERLPVRVENEVILDPKKVVITYNSGQLCTTHQIVKVRASTTDWSGFISEPTLKNPLDIIVLPDGTWYDEEGKHPVHYRDRVITSTHHFVPVFKQVERIYQRAYWRRWGLNCNLLEYYYGFNVKNYLPNNNYNRNSFSKNCINRKRRRKFAADIHNHCKNPDILNPNNFGLYEEDEDDYLEIMSDVVVEDLEYRKYLDKDL